MKTLTSALFISLLALSQFASAGTKTANASFQVSFVIAEACTIDSASARPLVNCQYNSPYQVQPTAAAATAAAAATTSAAHVDDKVMTVTF